MLKVEFQITQAKHYLEGAISETLRRTYIEAEVRTKA